MSFTIKSIPINDIHVNVLNPRYEPQESEVKEMNLIINQGKILGLIKDIAQFGLDPSENLIVSYDNELEAYVSEEGNRRITAVKLLKNPEITPSFTKNRDKFISKIYEIKSQFPNSTIKKVNCVIFTDSMTQDHFIELKHTGENDGAGRISWDRESKIRFSKEKNPFNLYLLEFMQNMFPGQSNFYTSTVETRIISDPNFRTVFEMEISKNPPKINFNSKKGYNRFYFVIDGLINKTFNVGDFYLKEDREIFINKHFGSINEEQDEDSVSLFNFDSIPLPEEIDMHSDNIETSKIYETESEPVTDLEADNNKFVETVPQNSDVTVNPNSLDLQNETGIVGRPYKNISEYHNLTKAIPFKNKFRKNLRINQTLKELSNIEYKNNPVASMYLLRSLLESYVNEYIDCFASRNDELRMKGISPKREKRTKKLRELLYDDIYIHLKDVIQHYSTTYELIKVTFTENNNTATTQIINHYVHSSTNYPDSSEILDAWQKINTIISSLDILLNNHSAN
jgi:hypothetical protein